MSSIDSLKKSALALTRDERTALLMALWSSLDPDPELTNEEQALLDERLAEHQKNPQDTIPLEEAERRLQARGSRS